MIKPKSDNFIDIHRTPSPVETRLDCLRMDKNEFLPCWPQKWFEEILAKIKPEHLSVHPEFAPLYAKIAAAEKVKQSNIVVTAGSDAAIRSVFEVFAAPDQEVIIVSPTFAMYYIYTRIYNARLVEVNYDEQLRIDINFILGSITKKTRIVAIANPNSPTGTTIGQDDLKAIVRKAGQMGAVVLIDEAYYPFHEETMAKHINDFDNLVVTRTFSKAAGLAGMRVGFLLANQTLAKLLFAVKPMYEVTYISALLAEHVLDNYDRVLAYAKATRQGKQCLADYFIENGFDVFQGQANFIHVDFGRQKADVVKFLQDNKVLFKDYFDHPSLKRFSRFTVGPKESVELLIKIFESYKKRK